MLVIISEDSKSGYKFWNTIRKHVLHNSPNSLIQIARPSNHIAFGGKNRELGGIGNIRTELNYQLEKLTKMGGKHLILLAIDSVNYNSGTITDTSIQVKNLISYIKGLHNGKIKNNYNLKNIEIQVTQYYCFEEIFLTFKYLQEFSGVHLAPAPSRQKAQELHSLVINTVCYPTWTDYSQLISESDRQFLYRKYKRKHNLKSVNDLYNREVLASLILEYITSVNKELFFRVDKKNIQSCWFHNCYNGENFHKNIRKSKIEGLDYCRGCVVSNNKYGKGSTKLGVLLTNSLFINQGLIDISKLRSYI